MSVTLKNWDIKYEKPDLNKNQVCKERQSVTGVWGGTHHGGLVLVDHHFFSFRNYAGARNKTNHSKAAATEASYC